MLKSTILKSLGSVTAVALTVGLLSTQHALAQTFEISSPAFGDNDLMSSKYAGKGGPRNCDGENIAPALSWVNPPEGTKSFAIVVTDAVGGHGTGIVHWVAYGIPRSTMSIDEGFGNQADAFTGGVNAINKPTYLGPCPDVGDAPHHYEFMVIALALEPGALAAGLTKDGLFEAIKGQNLAATSFVGRYARNK